MQILRDSHQSDKVGITFATPQLHIGLVLVQDYKSSFRKPKSSRLLPFVLKVKKWYCDENIKNVLSPITRFIGVNYTERFMQIFQPTNRVFKF